MPDLLPGTTILGQDTPPTVEAEETNDENNISSTSYIAGSVECSTTFLAPTSGRVEVELYGTLQGDGSNFVFLTWELYLGSDTSGTLITANAVTNGIRWLSTEAVNLQATKTQPGLTPGATYFVRTMHRVTGGTTADVLHRRISIKPAT